MPSETAFADGPEQPLVGGDVTDGIVRIGDTVRRARTQDSERVEFLLTHLEVIGFDGAPRLLGIDRQGRQVLSWLDGEVAGRPWPRWVADDDRVASVARLVRRYDDAVQGLGIPALYLPPQIDPPGWPPSIAGPATFVGHLDITPENVVFRDGSASALLDFDLARPTDRVREVCNMLLWWAPLMPPVDRDPAVRDVEPFARARLMVDAYGLGSADRSRIVETARTSAERTWFTMRRRAAERGGGWRRMWDDGIGDRIVRRQDWLREHGSALHDAVSRRH